MTRPRSQQLNDPATRYPLYGFRIAPTPGSSFLEIQNDGVHDDYEALLAASSSGLDTGLEEDLPAIAIGSVSGDPFLGLSPGNSFTVTLPGVNGGVPITVSLTSSEFVVINAATVATAARVAARVNAVLSGYGITVPVASRAPEGFLRFDSANSTGYTTGPTASVTVSNVSPGVLAALGFGAVASVIRTGVAKTRGIVTTSRDSRGGYVFPYANGRRVVQNSKIFKNAGRIASVQQVTQDVSPKQPIYGRLTKTPGSFLVKKLRIDWVTRALVGPEIRSTMSNFGSIVPGDGFHLTFIDTQYGISSELDVIFAATPTTVTDVVSAINDAWHTSSLGRVGSVQGSVSEPIPSMANSLVISLNGNAPVTTTFTGLERTAAEFAAAVNAAIATAGQGAQGSAASVLGRLTITSASITGASSSVEITNASNPEVLRALGLSVGIYVGTDVCFLNGAEIIIRPPSQFTTYTLVSSVGTTLTKLGINGQIPAFPSVRSWEVREALATYPSDLVSEASLATPTLSANGQASILFPEYMEAGDIPDNNFTVNAVQDAVSSAEFGSNWMGGALSSFSPIIADGSGKIPSQVMPTEVKTMKVGNVHFSGSTSALVPKKVIDFPSLSNTLETEFRSSDPARIRIFREYINDTGSVSGYEITFNSQWNGTNYSSDNPADASTLFRFDSAGFSMFERDAGASPFAFPSSLAGFHRGTIVSGTTVEMFMRSGVIRELTTALMFNDININANTSGKKIPLSGGTASRGDSTLRIAGLQSLAAGTASSLIYAINAKPFITCGDGSTSFGDFSGATALLQAANFISSQSITAATILMKSGSYTSTVVTFSNVDITLIGEAGAVINSPVAATDTIVFNCTTSNLLKVKDLTIHNSHATKKSVNVSNGILYADSCAFNDLRIKLGLPFNFGLSARVSNCIITGVTDAITLDFGTSFFGGGIAYPILFDGCLVSNGPTDTRCLVIRGGTGLSDYKSITFKTCNFILSPYSASADGGTGLGICTKNTGLVDLEPQNNGRIMDGLTVASLTYDNCTVFAGSSDYSCALQLPHLQAHLIPTDNGNYGVIKKLNFHNCTIGMRYTEFGNANIFNPWTTGTGAEEVNVVDTDFVMSPGGSGGGLSANPPAWSYWTVNEGISGEPGYGTSLFNPPALFPQWGTIVFASRRVNLRNVRVKDAFRLSFYSDIACFYGNLNANNVSVQYHPTNPGTGLTPVCRMFTSEVRGASGAHSTIWPGYDGTAGHVGVPNTAVLRDVRFEAFDVVAGQYWTASPGAFLFSFGKHLDIDGIVATGGTTAGAAPVIASPGGGGILVGSGDVTNPIVSGTTDVKIRNCKLSNLRYGIYYADTQNDPNESAGVDISNNYISNTTLAGIIAFAPYYTAATTVPFTIRQFDGVRVQNNTVVLCGASVGVTSPISIGVPANVEGAGHQALISGNIVQGLTNASCISIIPSYKGSLGWTGKVIPPCVSVTGNVCTIFGLGLSFTGEIAVIGWNFDTLSYKPILGWDVPSNYGFMTFGLETSYMPKDNSSITTGMFGLITLPQATITVTSTAGFSSFGTIALNTSGAGWTVKYTSKDATNFFGCTGGYSTVATNWTVTQAYDPGRNYETGLSMLYNKAILRNDNTI